MPDAPVPLCLILISFAFLIHHLANSQQAPIGTLSPEFENITVTGLLLVSMNPCSKTCGLGWRSEYYCGISQTGKRNNCVLKNALCLVSQECGLIAKTAAIGSSMNLSCLDETIETLGSSDFVFVWKLAKGLVTTDRYLFRMYLRRSRKTPWMMVLKDVKEKNAGTYMCQVQNAKTMQVVKRVLIAVRVIPDNLVQLNYMKVLSPAQKEELLVLQGKPVEKIRLSFWKNVKDLFKSASMTARAIFSGVAIGGAFGIAFGILFLCVSKKR
ncbi:transmembrane protein 81 [Amblyraja radiata]|uniref:transmembrane protein 81 n=1 Tax=Amblyraja radiata TaxID=386614 RepID=UPI0014039759|nr:transmembrane protein 81 [Amblyraja radiata]